MNGPEILIPLTAFAMITSIGLPLARALARRLDRPASPKLGSEAEARLERMEQAIDAIAIEIERISEGQRFTAQLLAGRGNERPAVGGHAEPTPEGRAVGGTSRVR